MAGNPDDRRHNARWLRERAVAVAVLAAFVLVFTWPFLRSPPLPLGASYLHLLFAWAVSIGALGAMARAFRRRSKREDDDA